jgi:hydrogenase assembly chaperone HypC/HupF
MCLAIPMRVVSSGEIVALCEGRGEQRRVDLTLVGPQPEGAWVLAFHDVAREVLSEEQAAQVNLALEGLAAALRGETDGLDAFFPDLAEREPQPPVGPRKNPKGS